MPEPQAAQRQGGERVEPMTDGHTAATSFDPQQHSDQPPPRAISQLARCLAGSPLLAASAVGPG